ncbi:MAG: hypothetical protein AAFQ51_00300 [Pseudomonadota bacterium]
MEIEPMRYGAVGAGFQPVLRVVEDETRDEPPAPEPGPELSHLHEVDVFDFG